jgi:hypothetical protein
LDPQRTAIPTNRSAAKVQARFRGIVGPAKAAVLWSGGGTAHIFQNGAAFIVGNDGCLAANSAQSL